MDVTLVLFKANGQRKDFPLTSQVTVVGRAEDCDLRVPLMDISRRHCEFRIDDDELTVKDLASSNGTYVNNKRVNEALVEPGDRIVLGPVIFTVQINGEPAEIAQPKIKKPAGKAPEAPADEIVDLEPDLMDTAAGGDAADALAKLGGDPDEDMDNSDVFSALEAMADDKKDKDE